MEQRYKNFLLLLAALACFAVGAVLFIGDDDMVYEQTEESEEEDNGGNGDAVESEETKDGDEAVLSSAVENGDTDFFENYRMQRDKRRDAQLELYREILSDDSRDEEAKDSAQIMLENLYQVAAVEDKVEEILIGRNYNDVIFVLEETVSLLIVKKTSLDEEEKAALTSFVSSYAGISADSLSVFTVD
jgi:hypothetical protein